jgi:uncharacterized oligopeptide transporter (OPT) family protein
MADHNTVNGLPKNAYRKLKKGESFNPVIPEGAPLPEVTLYALVWGLVYAVLFSLSAAYLALKIGQVFEAAIPIAILAVGVSTLLKRKNALSENVIIQSIGGSSGLIVAGAIFTIPGLYILGVEASFTQVFLASLLGGFLGILFLIPFRKYFVKDMHGEFPFPEATAITEVLVTGEAGGNKAKLLIKALAIGGIYNFLIEGFGIWKDKVSTVMFDWGRWIADQVRLEFNFRTGAAVLGLGYIIGLKYSLIIVCGSFLSWWVFIPAIYYIGKFNPEPILNAAKPLAEMMPQEIFVAYVQPIGIGGIAAAGIIGIIKSRKIIYGAFKLAANEIFGSKLGEGKIKKSGRLQTDISMKWNMVLLFSTLLGILAFFLIGVSCPGGIGTGYPDILSVYHSCCPGHRHCRGEPGFRHDPDDLDPVFGYPGGYWNQGKQRDPDCPVDRKCGLHCIVHGRRIHYRSEGGLLAGYHSQKPGAIQVSGGIAVGGFGRICYPGVV